MRPFRHCRAADLDTATEVLAAAFFDDPVFGWIYPDATTRAGHLRDWMGLAVRTSFARGHTYLAHDGGAATVWAPPDVSLEDDASRAEHGEMIVRHLGADAARLGGASGIAEMHPEEAHFYLRLVGVRPDRQGQGLGRSMLAPVLAMCDAEDLPAYLENSNPRNEAFYRSLGFDEVGRVQITDGPMLQGMWREPGTASG